MAAITITGLQKSYGDVEVLKGIDLSINDAEFVVFVGRSGCGKSTLLRCIAGLETISSGSITIDGIDITGRQPSQRGIAMVFQSYALYPHLTVRDNMGFSLELAKRPKREIAERVERAASILKIEELLDRRPAQLSGGQRQRVAIGRAIVREPKAFLFDEPLSNLDADLRVQMRHELMLLHQSLSATTIYVTHDQIEAMTMADKIVVLNAGRIEQDGTPLELYSHPKNLFVATFIGSPRMNVLSLSNSSLGGASEATHLGIRPEHIDIVPPNQGRLKGVIGLAEHLGADSYYFVDVEGHDTVSVRKTDGDVLGRGERVGLSFTTESAHFFRADGEAVAA